MKVVTEAKTKEEAVEKALKELNVEESEMFYSYEETKGKLFKAGSFKVTAYTRDDVMELMKDFIKELCSNLGIEVSFESNIREKQFNIKMFSDNNPILIGKGGRTMKAIETITKQKVQNDLGIRVKLFLDVENYNEKRIKQLERLAINTAKEVRNTKVEVALDNMNSYERRIIHNKLTNFKGVTTESTGEEPNRHIVIKPE